MASYECLRYVHARLHADGGTVGEALASYLGKHDTEEATTEEVEGLLKKVDGGIKDGNVPVRAIALVTSRPELKVVRGGKTKKAKKK